MATICSCGKTYEDILYSPCEECGEYESEEGYIKPLDFSIEHQYDLYEQEDRSVVEQEPEED